MDVLSNRIKRVVESVLENEGLAEGLEEAAAEALQQWTIKNVTRVAENTADVDDHAAEEAMYPHLRAARRLARAVRTWLQNEATSSPEERIKLWEKVSSRAKSLYGEGIILPDAAHFPETTPVEFIQSLRAWLENKE